MTPPPEFSYLELVERNNELVGRLVDLLSEVEIPPEARPGPGEVWQFAVSTRNPAWPLFLHLETRPGGLMVDLRTVDGYILGRHVWAWADPPEEGL